MSDVKFTLNDDVWRRVVQLVQLAVLTGVDVTDYFRQVQVTPVEGLTPVEGYPGVLEITRDYDELYSKTVETLQTQLQLKIQESEERGQG
jgi:hypothetical protein